VARRFNPELDAFLVADALWPVQAQAGLTVLPNYSFADRPAMDAFLIPGGFGTRQEMHNRRLHDCVRELPASCLLASLCTGSWVCLLDAGSPLPTSRSQTAPRPPASGRSRSTGSPRSLCERGWSTPAKSSPREGSPRGWELGFHLLRRAGWEEPEIREVAQVMEYHRPFNVYAGDLEMGH
jgi:hypothetical protein